MPEPTAQEQHEPPFFSLTPPEPPRVLVVDDDRDTRVILRAHLERRGARVVEASSVETAEAALAQDRMDVVIVDVNLRGESGLGICSRISTLRPATPVILVTASNSLDTAISAIRAGAYDFLIKPVDAEVLWASVQRAEEHHRLEREVVRLRRAVADPPAGAELIGRSAQMREVSAMIDRIGESDATVLLTGESGTGKELVAQALHQRSRPTGPFVVVNCAALPEPLLESELFGHARGAYTDARSARPGLFLRANGGTLFLDEIGEMPLALQPKLLRALQERKVRAVGSDVEVPFDARIVTATNRDLESAVAERRFRKDLYFRIAVIHVELPPLRDRGGDALLIAERFLERFSARAGKEIIELSPEVRDRLMQYPWPGNVRELQNCIEHAVALARGRQIRIEDLPQRLRDYQSSHVVVAADSPSELVPLAEVERRYILKVLEAVGGNKALAARVLRLDRTTLYRKLGRYGLGRAREAEHG